MFVSMKTGRTQTRGPLLVVVACVRDAAQHLFTDARLTRRDKFNDVRLGTMEMATLSNVARRLRVAKQVHVDTTLKEFRESGNFVSATPDVWVPHPLYIHWHGISLRFQPVRELHVVQFRVGD